jgi:hypothetical protein
MNLCADITPRIHGHREWRNLPDKPPFAHLASAAAWCISSLADIQSLGGAGLSPVCHRETGPSSGCYAVPVRYLVKYQNCGVSSYWVRFSNAVGVVEEMFVFQAHG